MVVKIIKNARASTDELDFQNEISIMSTLRHPNLVLFLGAVLENEPKMLVSEFLDGGSLEDFFECKFKDKMKPFLPPVAMVHRSLLSLLSSLFSLWSTASSFSLFSLSVNFFPESAQRSVVVVLYLSLDMRLRLCVCLVYSPTRLATRRWAGQGAQVKRSWVLSSSLPLCECETDLRILTYLCARCWCAIWYVKIPCSCTIWYVKIRCMSTYVGYLGTCTHC